MLQSWQSADVWLVGLHHGETSGSACPPGGEYVRNQAQALTKQEDGARSFLGGFQDNIANTRELHKAGWLS